MNLPLAHHDQVALATNSRTVRSFETERERYESLALALETIREREEAAVGEEDLLYIRRVNRISRTAEVIGRTLIHFSFEPITFSLGVGALWVHKQLQATEVGHTVLHGAFDKIPGDHGFKSEGYTWQTPIDERSWHRGHNGRHHGATNVAGRDPDIHFGPVRLTEDTPWTKSHRLQLLYTLFVLFPNFGALMNLHFTGAVDLMQGNGRENEFDFIKDRSMATKKDVAKRLLRKFVPYYAKEYVLFPLLAGPFFWKVMLGNWLSEMMRDVYSAATIYCGHVGEHTATYPEGTRPKGKGHWYEMQVEASNNFEVPFVLSVFCGALDHQIEHHLFPKLPTQRLRKVAPEVKAICAEHGVRYHTDSWPRTLKKALSQIARLSGPVETLRAAA